MKKINIIVLTAIALCLVLLSSKNPKSLIQTNYFQSEIDSLSITLNKISEETKIPGFAANIIQGDSIIFSRGFGYSDLENKHLFTPQTVHIIASISKTFIGVAMMKLVEDGSLKLDDPINNYLPFEVQSPHFPEVPITIRHLVTHTSSLNDAFDDGDKRPSKFLEKAKYSSDEIPESLAEDIYYYDGEVLSLEDYLESAFTPDGKWYAKSNFSEFKPGKEYEYSNEGSNLAALIIEKVSQMPFSKFTEKYIFEPLKMTHTSWYYQELDSTVSKLYVDVQNNKSSKLYVFPRFIDSNYPCGDLKSNAEDLSKYLSEMIKGFKGNGSILNATSYQTLFNSQFDSSNLDDQNDNALNDEYNVGVFWAISQPGFRLHKGGSIGVYSILYFNPLSDIGVVSYCNLAHPDFGKIVNTLRQFEKKLSENHEQID